VSLLVTLPLWGVTMEGGPLEAFCELDSNVYGGGKYYYILASSSKK
jgi:hypothetical protein